MQPLFNPSSLVTVLTFESIQRTGGTFSPLYVNSFVYDKVRLGASCFELSMLSYLIASIILLCQREKEPRKTTEDMDGQCKRRYGTK